VRLGADLTRFTGDSDVVDIDNDGQLDIVVARDGYADLNPAGSMQWYKNPGNLASNPNQIWQKFVIEQNVLDDDNCPSKPNSDQIDSNQDGYW